MSNKEYAITSHGEVFECLHQQLGLLVASFSELMKQLEASDTSWIALEGWQDLSDLEIFRSMTISAGPSCKLILVSEVSYRESSGAFVLGIDQVESFVDNHLNAFGECFFNGDAFFIDVDGRAIWAFHHEGAYAHFVMN
jgi:hypothetical protein